MNPKSTKPVWQTLSFEMKDVQAWNVGRWERTIREGPTSPNTAKESGCGARGEEPALEGKGASANKTEGLFPALLMCNCP